MEILLIYATQTGYTQEVAERLHRQLVPTFPRHHFELMSARQADKNIIKKYPLIFFGASTWDDGLNVETKLFLDNLTGADFAKNKFALFGLGDRQFMVFCAAQPIIETKLKERAANVLSPMFTFDNYQTAQNLNVFFNWAENILINFS